MGFLDKINYNIQTKQTQPADSLHVCSDSEDQAALFVLFVQEFQQFMNS